MEIGLKLNARTHTLNAHHREGMSEQIVCTHKHILEDVGVVATEQFACLNHFNLC